MTLNATAPYRSPRGGKALGVALGLAAAAALTTACSSDTGTNAQGTSSPKVTREAAPTAPEKGHTSTPESSGTPSRGGADVVASKDGVTVKKPIRKESGDSFWVGVEVANDGDSPARYVAYIRLTGPLGYNALLHVDTDVLQPGKRASAVHTVLDEAGTKPVPKNPTVVIVSVDRTPA